MRSEVTRSTSSTLSLSQSFGSFLRGETLATFPVTGRSSFKSLEKRRFCSMSSSGEILAAGRINEAGVGAPQLPKGPVKFQEKKYSKIKINMATIITKYVHLKYLSTSPTLFTIPPETDIYDV